MMRFLPKESSQICMSSSTSYMLVMWHLCILMSRIQHTCVKAHSMAACHTLALLQELSSQQASLSLQHLAAKCSSAPYVADISSRKI